MRHTWSNVPEAVAEFNKILAKPVTRGVLLNFRHKLNMSVENVTFRSEMAKYGALLNWDEDNEMCCPPWTEETMKASAAAINKCMKIDTENTETIENVVVGGTELDPKSKADPKREKEKPAVSAKLMVRIPRTASVLKRIEPVETNSDESGCEIRESLLLSKTGYRRTPKSKPPIAPKPEVPKAKARKTLLPLRDEWHHLFGDSITFLDPLAYIKIKDIVEKPTKSTENIRILAPLFPFILQKIQMWSCNILTAESLNEFLSQEEENWSDDEAENDNTKEIANEPTLSKLDILTLLAASTEVTVLADIFQNISKYPISLPLILPNPVATEKSKFSIVIPALEKCLIKWEQQGKPNGENYLFKNPYKLITAIRVGENKTVGKSSFLNQIFLQSHIFQCRGQPGGGKPISLDGSVEFIWLTKDTCKESIWTAVQKEMKDSLENEVVLLANLHGDALKHEDCLRAMQTFTSKFLVFAISDEELEEKLKSLENILGKENMLFLYVNPTIMVDKFKTLKTELITNNNETLNKLKQYISRALKKGRSISAGCPQNQNISSIREIFANDSKEFIEIINQLNSSGGNARSIFRLQRISRTDHDQFWTTYKKSPALQQLMTKFAKVLQLPLPARRFGLTHIEQELLILSTNKLAGYSSEFTNLLRERNSMIGKHPKMKEINEKIGKIYKEYENLLALNDILRELSILFEIVSIHGLPQEISMFSQLPAYYAELLLEGRTLEILDGNSGSVPGIWLESVCHSVCQNNSNLKVFVVSILGLQSSGKSTLLNALFGCKFATSVGKCTKGLYLRLILLEESFKQQLGLDAILVVDTEGLGSPESMLDPTAESKDRTMATFAMAISNLILINVAGESNNVMVNILQIVILTMARMEKTDLSPDILLVQQVPEGGKEVTLAKGVDNFCNALEEAMKIIQSRDIDLGVKTERNLKTLKKRLRTREILYQLRPFKSGASPQAHPTEEYCQDVVGLRKRIIDEFSRKKNNFIYFCTWHKLLKGYWEAVQKENFALKFTSIRQVQEFIEVNTKTESVKNHFNQAFQNHERHLSQIINERLKILAHQKVAREFEAEIHEMINSQFDVVPKSCQIPLRQSTSDTISCKWCRQAERSRKSLLEFVKQTSAVSVSDTEENLNSYIQDLQNIAKTDMLRKFESLKIQLGKASNFDTILIKILRDSKRNMAIPSVEEIWDELQEKVHDKYPIRFMKSQVIYDIVKAYERVQDVMKWNVDLTNMSFSEADPRRTLAVLKVKKRSPLKIFSKPDLDLTTNEHSWLCTKFQEIAESVVSIRRKERGGYVDVLVIQHKNKVQKALEDFETRFKTKLIPQFKYDAMFYSLQLFLQVILHLQDEWNQEFEPYFIFLSQKQEYLQKIGIHLGVQSPLQVISFGNTIGRKLLEAAQLICTNSFEVKKYDNKWATKAESIRIRYLVSLAEDLNCGNESVVLGHFRNPEQVHLEWYMQAFQLSLQNVVTPLVQEAFMKECGELEIYIATTKSMEELLIFINWYLNKIGDSVQLPNVSENIHPRLKEEIQKEISKSSQEFKEEMTMDYHPVNYEQYLNKLGCMSTCPGCSALCWGAKNHENGIGKFKLHFTCHQPKGLAGVVDEETGQLEFRSCCQDADKEIGKKVIPLTAYSDRDNTDPYTDNDNVEGQWMMEEHPIEECNQIMKWFFLKLKYKLAEEFNVPLSKSNQTDDNQLVRLDKELDNILNLLRHKSDL